MKKYLVKHNNADGGMDTLKEFSNLKEAEAYYDEIRESDPDYGWTDEISWVKLVEVNGKRNKTIKQHKGEKA